MPSLRELEAALAADNGRRLGERRRYVGLTQVRLADLIGIPQRTYSSYETGLRPIPDGVKVRAAEVLHMKVRELFPLELPNG